MPKYTIEIDTDHSDHLRLVSRGAGEVFGLLAFDGEAHAQVRLLTARRDELLAFDADGTTLLEPS